MQERIGWTPRKRQELGEEDRCNFRDRHGEIRMHNNQHK